MSHFDRGDPLDMASLAEVEAANIRLVEQFLASWHEPHKTDISFLDPDGMFRTNDLTREAKNAEQLIEYLKGVLPPEARVVLETHEIRAIGPLVVTSRTDIVRMPGRPDRIFEIASHFLVKQGKIAEWTDHVYSWREAD